MSRLFRPQNEAPSPEGSTSRGEAITEISLKQRFFNLRTLVSFLLAFAIIFFLITKLDVDLASIWANLRQANPFLFAIGFLIYYLTFPVRGLRWRLLLNNAGLDRDQGARLPSLGGLMEIIVLSWFVNCIVPAKLGDAYRGYLLTKNGKVSFAKTMGTILSERIFDMAVLFALLAIAAAAVIGTGTTGTALGVVEMGFGLVAILGLGLLAMRRFGGRIRRLLPLRLKSGYGRFEEGTLGSFRQLPLILSLTGAVWLLESGRLFFVTRSLDSPISLSLVLFIALANALLTTLPFTPGGLGLVEAGVVGLLMIAVSKDQALSIALLDRSITYWSVILLGLATFILSRKR